MIRRLLLLVLLVAPSASAWGADVDRTVDRLLDAGRPDLASRYLHVRVALDPHARDGWLLLGEVERRRCALDVAELAYRHLLDRDPFDGDALAGMGEVLLSRGRPAEALVWATAALALEGPRRTARLWRVRALALLEQARPQPALEAARRAVALAPGDGEVLECLARAAYRTGDMARSRELYQRATSLDPRLEESNLRLGSGFGPLLDDETWPEARRGADWNAAVSAWRAGDLDTAVTGFGALVASRPEVFKYRLGLGLALTERRRRGELRYGGDPAACYLRIPAPEPPDLERYVVGYEDLDAIPRHAVRVAVAPAAPWLPALLRAGATHDVLALDDSLADRPDRAYLATKETFDGRVYAHLRGVGGLAAASGVEKLRTAASFGFHTFAHEFAHQVLRFAFPDDLQAEVEALYASALRTGSCLDWYAASNADEYFAQGYEAFVSPAKRGCLRETQRHTREELRSRDPDLHAFLERHLDLDHEAPEAMAPFWVSLADLAGAGTRSR